MGYSMGARITAHMALASPERMRSVLLGGLGIQLVEGVGLPLGIADAMEAPSLDDLTDPMQRMFRAFAEQNGSDLKALAACIRGSRQVLTKQEVASITLPTLVSVGTNDDVSGSGPELAGLMPERDGARHSRAATTTLPWATRFTSRACSTSSPAAPEALAALTWRCSSPYLSRQEERMTRLDSAIRRLTAQRELLDWARGRSAPTGLVLELGLGNGRTYDHLRDRLPGREIYAFERSPAAHPDCYPPEGYLIVGDHLRYPAGLHRTARTGVGCPDPHRYRHR